MTLYEFNILELNNKMEVINQTGIYLDIEISSLRETVKSIEKSYLFL